MKVEAVAKPSFLYTLKNYVALTKPGIIMGNAITAAGGFALASRRDFDFSLFIAMIFGISLVVASGCVCNNYIDRDFDKKMIRTKNRALAKGEIEVFSALAYAAVLGFLGFFVLGLLVNTLSMLMALFGFLVYVTWYSFLKHHSKHGTLIGSIAGSIPPLVGYVAVSEQIDLGAIVLFAIVTLWQMPHFYAIAIYRLKEYKAASIPVLPLVNGIKATKVQMLLYTVAFAVASSLLYVFGYAGVLFLIVSSVLGLMWIALSVYGFKCDNDAKWARKMFVFSLIVIMSINLAIPFSFV